MSDSKLPAMGQEVHRAREAYANALADVAWQALYEAGLYHLKPNGPEYEKLADFIRFEVLR